MNGENDRDEFRKFGDPPGQRHVGGRRRDTHTPDKVLTHGHTLLFYRYRSTTMLSSFPFPRQPVTKKKSTALTLTISGWCTYYHPGLCFNYLAGLSDASGCNTCCLSYIKVYGEISSYNQADLLDLERRFAEQMSRFLKLNDPSLVYVVTVSGGSITFFFLLPLQASRHLWMTWRKHPRHFQNAMRGLVTSAYPKDPIPVLAVGSVLDDNLLLQLSKHRLRKDEMRQPEPAAGRMK